MKLENEVDMGCMQVEDFPPAEEDISMGDPDFY
jgi:hypothetical protein